jgi:3-phenylpropionate/trans-cinnamate dioxygenase ferredoxin reductase subunit
VVGVGVVPETALAEAAGLATENGIAVDATLRTSDPAIFAAGDCAAAPHPLYGRRLRIETWRTAQDQGVAAARNMLGAEAPFSRVPWFWSDHFDLGLQSTGLHGAGCAAVTRQTDASTLMVFALAPDGRLVAASGLGPGNAVAKDVRLAEMLIERGARPDPAALADPGIGLKSLLRAAGA